MEGYGRLRQGTESCVWVWLGGLGVASRDMSGTGLVCCGICAVAGKAALSQGMVRCGSHAKARYAMDWQAVAR